MIFGRLLRLFQFAFEGLEHTLADFEISGRHTVQQALLQGIADAGRAYGEVAAGAGQVDAPGATIVLVLAPLDEAAPLQAVEQTDQRGAFDRHRRRQLLLAHAIAQRAEIDQWPPRRLGQADQAHLGIDSLPQPPRQAGDEESEFGMPVGCHNQKDRTLLIYLASPHPAYSAAIGGPVGMRCLPSKVSICSFLKRL